MEPLILPDPTGENDFTIALGRQNGAVEEDLQGMTGVSVFLSFSVGTASTGASAVAYIQTSFAGEAFFDIAAVEFTDETQNVGLNIDGEAVQSPAVLTDGEMTPGTILHGMLGDRLRAVVDTTGTYTGPTTLAVRAQPRP